MLGQELIYVTNPSSPRQESIPVRISPWTRPGESFFPPPNLSRSPFEERKGKKRYVIFHEQRNFETNFGIFYLHARTGFRSEQRPFPVPSTNIDSIVSYT